MNLQRLGPLLPISIAVVIVTATVLAATHHRSHASHASSPPGEVAASSAGSAVTTSIVSGLPTTDIFGNRLEVPADPAGVPLAQDPTSRPNPGQSDYLTVAPNRLQWQRGWGGAALPVSGSDGPAAVDSGVASGFAETPQGAALSACDAIARAFAAPDGVWQNVIRSRFRGGEAALIARIGKSRLETLNAATYLVVPEGIRVLPGYRSDFAVVQIAVRASTGWAFANWPMVWSDGDWRVRVPDDVESLWQSAVPISSLTEFGNWKGAPS
ncbi:hypothetical protein [Nocardia sp. NPDC059228]|uniref:hypothetical protein n=1 Tax=Nocardia sp. NPDC059228 TaxID=3346777 RepID=UPI00369C7C37